MLMPNDVWAEAAAGTTEAAKAAAAIHRVLIRIATLLTLLQRWSGFSIVAMRPA